MDGQRVVNETCACGAKFVFATKYDSEIRITVTEWREEHQCTVRAGLAEGWKSDSYAVLTAAKNLLSEDGENLEYDRALRELVRDVYGETLPGDEGWEDRYLKWRTIQQREESLKGAIERFQAWAEEYGIGVRESRYLTNEERATTDPVGYGVSVIFRDPSEYRLWERIKNLIDVESLELTESDDTKCLSCGQGGELLDSGFGERGVYLVTMECPKTHRWYETYAYIGRSE